MTTFIALERWESSEQGRVCFANAKLIESEGVAGVAQAHSAALCNSQMCGGAMSAYITALEDAGCADWGAYRLKRVQYDLICYKADDTSHGTVKVKHTFCSGVFNTNKYRRTVRDVAKSTLPESTLESELLNMCTPCFQQYLQIMNRFSPVDLHTSGLYAAEKMCVDDVVGAERQFCYPRYRNRRRDTSTLGHNAKARELCAVDMGNCARKMLIRDSVSSTDNHTISDIDYMCLRRISKEYADDEASDAMLCADQMQAHVGGYGANRIFSGNPYQAPAACNALVAENATCTWGCQRTYTPERDAFGCCYNTIKEYYELLEHEDVSNVFRSSDLVGAECNRPADSSCDILNEGEGVEATMIVDVPVSYLRDSSVEITGALMQDMERAVGRSAAGLLIRGYRYHSVTSTAVDFVSLP